MGYSGGTESPLRNLERGKKEGRRKKRPVTTDMRDSHTWQSGCGVPGVFLLVC